MAKELKVKKSQVTASVFKRLMAFLIDLVVLNYVVIWPFRRVVMKLVPIGSVSALSHALETNAGTVQQLNLIYMFIGLLVFLYFTLTEFWYQQSLGKMVLGLFVQSGQKQPGFWQIAIRNLFSIPLLPFILIWVVDPLSLIFSRRRLSDMITRTNVVKHETRLF